MNRTEEDSRLSRIQTLWRAVADAEEAERAARASRAEARKKVLAAKQALDNYIAEAARPLPLFEQAEANGKPKKGRKKKADAVRPPAKVVTRDTFLIDLLTGEDVSKAGRTLETAGLHTVGDLLNKAAATPKKVSVGTHYEDGTATVYEVLHGVKGLPKPAAMEIGDALVDARLTGAAAAKDEGWRTCKVEDLELPPGLTMRLKDAGLERVGALYQRFFHGPSLGLPPDEFEQVKEALKLVANECLDEGD